MVDNVSVEQRCCCPVVIRIFLIYRLVFCTNDIMKNDPSAAKSFVVKCKAGVDQNIIAGVRCDDVAYVPICVADEIVEESNGELEVTMSADGSWTLRVEKSESGVDNTAQADGIEAAARGASKGGMEAFMQMAPVGN